MKYIAHIALLLSLSSSAVFSTDKTMDTLVDETLTHIKQNYYIGNEPYAMQPYNCLIEVQKDFPESQALFQFLDGKDKRAKYHHVVLWLHRASPKHKETIDKILPGIAEALGTQEIILNRRREISYTSNAVIQKLPLHLREGYDKASSQAKLWIIYFINPFQHFPQDFFEGDEFLDYCSSMLNSIDLQNGTLDGDTPEILTEKQEEILSRYHFS